MKSPTRKAPFLGAGSALATPFCEDGIDACALQYMIEYQITHGIDALILCGTTGESVTVTEREYEEVLALASEKIDGRVPYIVGCGSADTAHAVERARVAQKNGADALLVVTPYYNKGTADGLVQHYHSIADAVDLPLIVYHVPGRTGVRLSCETFWRIAEHPHVVGIKEASGDMELFAQLSAMLGERLSLYSGCDALILPSLALGGSGVISVVSNLRPHDTSLLCQRFWQGDFEGALAIQRRLAPLISLLFAEVNPAPLKCALAFAGMCEERLRLPLSPVSASLRERIAREMELLEDE